MVHRTADRNKVQCSCLIHQTHDSRYNQVEAALAAVSTSTSSKTQTLQDTSSRSCCMAGASAFHAIKQLPHDRNQTCTQQEPHCSLCVSRILHDPMTGFSSQTSQNCTRPRCGACYPSSTSTRNMYSHSAADLTAAPRALEGDHRGQAAFGALWPHKNPLVIPSFSPVDSESRWDIMAAVYRYTFTPV